VAALDSFFDVLLQRKGSDLHLSVGRPPTVRLRGTLVGFRSKPVDAAELDGLLLEILTPEQRRELESERDLDFAYPYEDKARFRVSYFYKKGQDPRVQREMGAVFRVIPTQMPALAELGTPPAIKMLADRTSGLVLVTGPTGSGKSTTLAAMIRHINESRACHILTIEDPIEFVHAPIKAEITQREIGRHAPDFATALKSAGREDADVILIGELRNNETMKMALQLASFGVLVFGTVHTNSAPATIDRVLNAFPAEEQAMVRGLLASSLAGVVAQQLVPTADGNSRCAAHEILLGSPALASMIREQKTFQIPNLMQSGQNLGMQTMDMALARLVAKGKVSKEAALEKASDKEAFMRAGR
jgi:twitching motility protein PilT